jgi:hypothetical protein
MKARKFVNTRTLGDERIFGRRQILMAERDTAGQDFVVADR